MARGLSAVNLANAWLNVLRGGGAGVTFTAPAVIGAKLYIGDPGATGVANAAAVTTRQAVTLAAASAGAIALSNTPSWSMTATETISDIGLFDSLTVGNFLDSIQLTTPRSVVNGDTLNLNTLTITLATIAA
jgi:hypothetical protein